MLTLEFGPAMALRNVRTQATERCKIVGVFCRLSRLEGGQGGEGHLACGLAGRRGGCAGLLAIAGRGCARGFQIPMAAMAQPLLAGTGKSCGLVAQFDGRIDGQRYALKHARAVAQQVGLQRLAIGEGPQRRVLRG